MGPGISCAAWGLRQPGTIFEFITRYAYTSPRLDRCLIFANNDSGLHIDCLQDQSHAFPIVSHCCFYNNGRYAVTAKGKEISVDLVNSIVSASYDMYIHTQGEAKVMSRYCLFDGPGLIPEGEGNLQDDPLWLDPENGGFSLLDTSPAIDAGTCPAEGIASLKVPLPISAPWKCRSKSLFSRRILGRVRID